MRHRHLSTLILAAALVGSAACHVPAAYGHTVGGVSVGPDIAVAGAVAASSRAAPQAGYGRPVQADFWLDEHSGYASIGLSRSAYVAVIALNPMGAIELLYPSGRYGRRLRPGLNDVRVRRWSYSLAAGAAGWGDWSYRQDSPIYVLMIASDRRLDLDMFRSRRPLPWLGWDGRPLSPFDAADAIAREIVPYGGWDDWTLEYQVVWPGSRIRPHRRTLYTRVRCAGGSLVLVAAEAISLGWYSCPDRYDWWARGHPHYRFNRYQRYDRHVHFYPYADRDRDRRRDPYRGRAVPRTTRPDLPDLRETATKRPRPTGWRGATPTREGEGRELRGSARPRAEERTATPSRPSATPRTRPVATPAPRRAVPRPTPERPETRPQPRAAPRPESRPAPSARPSPERRTQVRPAPRAAPRPEPSRARPVSRPEPRSQPRARPAPRPEPSRARPAPSRPEPRARPAPSRPVERSKPERPARRPRPEAKPTKRGGGGGAV